MSGDMTLCRHTELIHESHLRCLARSLKVWRKQAEAFSLNTPMITAADLKYAVCASQLCCSWAAQNEAGRRSADE